MVFFDVDGRAFRFYKAYMKVSGALFLDRRPLRSKIFFAITTISQVMTALMYLIHPAANCLPVEYQHANNDQIFDTTFGVLARIGLWIYSRSMGTLIESTTEDSIPVIEDPEEQKFRERHSRHGAFLFYGLTPLGISVTLVRFMLSVSIINKSTSVHRRETCELTGDEGSIILFPILGLISYVFNLHTFSTIHLFFWNFAMHLSAQYKILKKQFQDFLSIRDKKVRREEFRRLVDRHNQLLDLSGNLEDSFTFIAAFHILIFQVLLCKHTFRLFTTANVFSMTTLLRLPMGLVLALVISAYYYAGDYLAACSEEIGDVFTQCNWYDLSKESITDFSIVIARCQKPVKLTAAKMYKLNLSNLKYVFNALYSYMTCIAAVVKATHE